MEPEAVAEYVEESRQLIETSPRMDEQNTKVRLIQPFLELLGWNLRSTEVELEYRVAMGSSTTHVDYALLVGDAPVVFVEAKPINSSLSDSDVRQLRSYMRQELEVDWGILTNGQSFEVLTKSRSTRNGEEISVVQFDLDDLDNNPDILEILSKEAIRTGKADEIAEQVARTNAVIGQLTEDESRVAESVAEAIESEVGEFPIDLEEQAREFVQDLVTVLREQRQFVSDDTPAIPDEDESQTEGEPQTSRGSPDQKSTEDREGYVIEFSDGKVVPEDNQEAHTLQKQNMGAAIDYLIKEYNLVDQIEVPHFPPKARKNCSINTEPVHPNGEEIRIPYELTNGYYLHTSLNTRGKKNRIRDLAEQVELSVEFLGEW
jgi:hypothetical protein